MKVDMSPEAITNRLKMMGQLWELSVSSMKAKKIEKSLEKDLNDSREDKTSSQSDEISSENVA